MQKTKLLVITALFTALTCAATMAIRIPTPGTGGYIHPGDAIVILCGIFLSPASAFLAAGLGSCMADLLGGYFLFMPITFLIKGTVALSAAFLYRFLCHKTKNPYPAVAACGVADIILVAGGYGIFEFFLYGGPAAIAGVPANIIQGISGLIISTALFPLLSVLPEIRRIIPH